MAREQVEAHAMVLRAVDYGERDVVLTLLLEGMGKRSAIAKGGKASKRRFAGALEKFRVSRFSFTDRGPDKMAVLGEAKVVEDYPGIERSFDKISVAAYATEMVRELLRDGEGGQGMFASLVRHYRQLSQCEDEIVRLEADLHTFTLRTLSRAGFAPSLTRCVRSGVALESSPRWRFLLTGQGLLHPDQRRPGDHSVEIARDVVEIMRGMGESYVELPPPAGVLRQMRPMMQGMVHAALGKELRSREYLKMVMG